MGALELRNKIIEIINTSDERFLRMVNALHTTYKEGVSEEIVAYSVQGTPLTKERYIEQIKEADASISSGEYTTVEDLEKEVQNW